MPDASAQPTDTIVGRFEALGGQFRTAPAELAATARRCRALLFDWDGVFNSGSKSAGAGSHFDEPDSMGTNMLRYGLWRLHGQLPFAAVISGASNANAAEFARREHFSEVYLGIRDKRAILDHLCERDGLAPSEIACVFDDINDLPLAAGCGLRVQVRRDAGPLFTDYVRRHALCDYVTGCTGGAHAVREVSELLLGLLGEFDAVVESRAAHDEVYTAYFASRQAVETGVFTAADGAIVRRAD